MLQIGISNVPEKRLGTHARNGWELLEVRGPMVGDLARNLETAMLRAIRTRGGVLANTLGIERFDGWSEAWTKQSLTVIGLKQLLEWVYDDGDPSAIG